MTFTPSIKSFNIFRDQQGGDSTPIRVPPAWVNKKTLTANTHYEDTVPTGATMVLISSNADLFVNLNGNASTSDASDGTGSELNPEGYGWNLDTGNPTSISVISKSAADVTFSYYKI